MSHTRHSTHALVGGSLAKSTGDAPSSFEFERKPVPRRATEPKPKPRPFLTEKEKARALEELAAEEAAQAAHAVEKSASCPLPSAGSLSNSISSLPASSASDIPGLRLSKAGSSDESVRCSGKNSPVEAAYTKPGRSSPLNLFGQPVASERHEDARLPSSMRKVKQMLDESKSESTINHMKQHVLPALVNVIENKKALAETGEAENSHTHTMTR